jgi:hypothetical protein
MGATSVFTGNRNMVREDTNLGGSVFVTIEVATSPLEILINNHDFRKAIPNDVWMVFLFPNGILIFLNAVGEDTDHGGNAVSKDTDHGGKSAILPQPSNEKRALIRHCEKTP